MCLGVGREPAGSGREPAPTTTQREDPYLTLARLPMPEQTMRLIQRQEALQERGRPPFSVIVVVVGLPGDDPDPALRLLHVFRGRARVGDELGWIADDRIALILPLTPPGGARRLAEEIAARTGLAGSMPFRVYTSSPRRSVARTGTPSA